MLLTIDVSLFALSFCYSKGFGFIEQEGGGEDVFVHHSALESDGYRSLQEGQAVEFEITKEEKGLRAASAKPS